jgi:proton-dependent oligopeptide transporter, POT family
VVRGKQLNSEMITHPKGLFFLFFTEMWERFSYYGMRALLVYYMRKHLLFPQDYASHVYGIYTGFVYLTPLFGGLLADRYLGQRRTVILGSVLMALESLFYPALVFLILGNGAFKPNTTTQVGTLYPPGDHRRDRAYSVFYLGINLGAFFSPLVCGTLGELYGWHWGFGAAGIGMLAGLAVYISGRKYLPEDYLVQRESNPVICEKEPGEKGKILALFAILVFTIFFWAVFEQQGNTMALWADEYTERHFGTWEMPASWFQSFNPLMIMLLTPAVISFWRWQEKRGREPSSLVKMGIGCILAGISFFLMMMPAQSFATHNKASVLWLVAFIFLITLGELYLSPVGLSLVTKLAPARMASMLMGTWFLASFGGNYLSGFLGTFWGKMPKGYYFPLMALIASVAGIGILALVKPLRKMMDHGSRSALPDEILDLMEKDL